MLFSTEQVSKYHPDKYCDQISDAILDACLKEDPESRVAVEAMAKKSAVFLAGEVTTKAHPNYLEIVRRVSTKLGYPLKSFYSLITEQSPDIAAGVKGGKDLRAGDQGMMFGYACNENKEMLPEGFRIANHIIERLEMETELGDAQILHGDAKCQVTMDDETGRPNTVLISACHRSDIELGDVRKYVEIIARDAADIEGAQIIVNPAGAWTIGGPAADCGLTGRKIVCDQYGGYMPVGGGAFSGKDPSKVDRSGAYMARKIACDALKEFELQFCTVQLSYMIGVKEPVGIMAACESPIMDEEIVKWVRANYDLTPRGIIEQLNLTRPIYEKLAEGCHFRRGTNATWN